MKIRGFSNSSSEIEVELVKILANSTSGIRKVANMPATIKALIRAIGDTPIPKDDIANIAAQSSRKTLQTIVDFNQVGGAKNRWSPIDEVRSLDLNEATTVDGLKGELQLHIRSRIEFLESDKTISTVTGKRFDTAARLAGEYVRFETEIDEIVFELVIKAILDSNADNIKVVTDLVKDANGALTPISRIADNAQKIKALLRIRSLLSAPEGGEAKMFLLGDGSNGSPFKYVSLNDAIGVGKDDLDDLIKMSLIQGDEANLDDLLQLDNNTLSELLNEENITLYLDASDEAKRIDTFLNDPAFTGTMPTFTTEKLDSFLQSEISLKAHIARNKQYRKDLVDADASSASAPETLPSGIADEAVPPEAQTGVPAVETGQATRVEVSEDAAAKVEAPEGAAVSEDEASVVTSPVKIPGTEFNYSDIYGSVYGQTYTMDSLVMLEFIGPVLNTELRPLLTMDSSEYVRKRQLEAKRIVDMMRNNSQDNIEDIVFDKEYLQRLYLELREVEIALARAGDGGSVRARLGLQSEPDMLGYIASLETHIYKLNNFLDGSEELAPGKKTEFIRSLSEESNLVSRADNLADNISIEDPSRIVRYSDSAENNIFLTLESRVKSDINSIIYGWISKIPPNSKAPLSEKVADDTQAFIDDLGGILDERVILSGESVSGEALVIKGLLGYDEALEFGEHIRAYIGFMTRRVLGESGYIMDDGSIDPKMNKLLMLTSEDGGVTVTYSRITGVDISKPNDIGATGFYDAEYNRVKDVLDLQEDDLLFLKIHGREYVESAYPDMRPDISTSTYSVSETGSRAGIREVQASRYYDHIEYEYELFKVLENDQLAPMKISMPMEDLSAGITNQIILNKNIIPKIRIYNDLLDSQNFDAESIDNLSKALLEVGEALDSVSGNLKRKDYLFLIDGVESAKQSVIAYAALKGRPDDVVVGLDQIGYGSPAVKRMQNLPESFVSPEEGLVMADDTLASGGLSRHFYDPNADQIAERDEFFRNIASKKEDAPPGMTPREGAMSGRWDTDTPTSSSDAPTSNVSTTETNVSYDLDSSVIERFDPSSSKAQSISEEPFPNMFEDKYFYGIGAENMIGSYIIYSDGPTPLGAKIIWYRDDSVGVVKEAMAEDVIEGSIIVEVIRLNRNQISIKMYSKLKTGGTTRVYLGSGPDAMVALSSDESIQRIRPGSWSESLTGFRSTGYSGPYKNIDNAFGSAGLQRATSRSPEALVDDAEVEGLIVEDTASVSMRQIVSDRSINLAALFDEETGISLRRIADHKTLSANQKNLFAYLSQALKNPDPPVKLFKSVDGKYYIITENGSFVRINGSTMPASEIESLHFKITQGDLYIANYGASNIDYESITSSKNISFADLMPRDNSGIELSSKISASAVFGERDEIYLKDIDLSTLGDLSSDAEKLLRDNPSISFKRTSADGRDDGEMVYETDENNITFLSQFNIEISGGPESPSNVLMDIVHKILGKPKSGSMTTAQRPDPEVKMSNAFWETLSTEAEKEIVGIRSGRNPVEDGIVADSYIVGDRVRYGEEEGLVVKIHPSQIDIPGGHIIVRMDAADGDGELISISDSYDLRLIGHDSSIGREGFDPIISSGHRSIKDMEDIAEQYRLTPTIRFESESFDPDAERGKYLVLRPTILDNKDIENTPGSGRIQGLIKWLENPGEGGEYGENIVGAYILGGDTGNLPVVYVLRKPLATGEDIDVSSDLRNPLLIVSGGKIEAPINIPRDNVPRQVRRRVDVELQSFRVDSEGNLQPNVTYKMDIYIPGDENMQPHGSWLEKVSTTLRPMSEEETPVRAFTLKAADDRLANAGNGSLIKIRYLDDESLSDILRQALANGFVKTDEQAIADGVIPGKLQELKNRDARLGLNVEEGEVIAVDAVMFSTRPVESGNRQIRFVWNAKVYETGLGELNLPRTRIKDPDTRTSDFLIEEPQARFDNRVRVNNVSGIIDFMLDGSPVLKYDDIDPTLVDEGDNVVITFSKRRAKQEGVEEFSGRVTAYTVPEDDVTRIIISVTDRSGRVIENINLRDGDISRIRIGSKENFEWNSDLAEGAERVSLLGPGDNSDISKLCEVIRDLRNQLYSNVDIKIDDPFFRSIFSKSSKRLFDRISKYSITKSEDDLGDATVSLNTVIDSFDLIEESGQISSITIKNGRGGYIKFDIAFGGEGYRFSKFMKSDNAGESFTSVSPTIRMTALESLVGFKNSSAASAVSPGTRQYLGAVIRPGNLRSIEVISAGGVKVEVEESGIVYVYHILRGNDRVRLDQNHIRILQRSGIDDVFDLSEGHIIRYRTTSVVSSGNIDAFFLAGQDGLIDTWYQASRASEPFEVSSDPTLSIGPKNTFVISGISGGRNRSHIDSINEFYDNPGVDVVSNPFVLEDGKGLLHRTTFDQRGLRGTDIRVSSEYVSEVLKDAKSPTKEYVDFVWPTAPTNRELNLLIEDIVNICENCREGMEVPGIGVVDKVYRDEDGVIISIDFRVKSLDARGKEIRDEYNQPVTKVFNVPYNQLRGYDTGYDLLKALATSGSSVDNAISLLATEIKNVFQQYDELGIGVFLGRADSRIKVRFDAREKRLIPVRSYGSEVEDDIVELTLKFSLPLVDNMGNKLEYFDMIMGVALDALRFRNSRLAEAERKVKQAAALAGMLQNSSRPRGLAKSPTFGLERKQFDALRGIPSVEDAGADSGRRPVPGAPYKTKEQALWNLIYGRGDDPNSAGFLAVFQEIDYHPITNNYGINLSAEFELISEFGKTVTMRYGDNTSGENAESHRKNIEALFSIEGMFGERVLNPPSVGDNPLNFNNLGGNRARVKYQDGVLRTTDSFEIIDANGDVQSVQATFGDFYNALKALALKVDNSIADDIFNAAKRKASSPLSELIDITRKSDEQNKATIEFLLQSSHLPQELATHIAKSYKKAARMALKDSNRLLKQNLKYHTDPKFNLRGQRRLTTPSARNEGQGTALFQNETMNRLVDRLMGAQSLSMDAGFEYMMGTNAAEDSWFGLLRVPGALHEHGSQGMSWMRNPYVPELDGVRSSVGLWSRESAPFFWRESFPRFFRIIGGSDALSLQRWSDWYYDGGRLRQTMMFATTAIHNAVAHVISLNAAVFKLPISFLLKWFKYSSFVSIGTGIKMIKSGNGKWYAGAGLTTWGALCLINQVIELRGGTANTAVRRKLLELLSEDPNGNVGMINREQFDGWIERFVATAPICATDLYHLMNNEYVKRNFYRQRDAIVKDMASGGSFDQRLRSHIQTFVMAGVYQEKGGNCTKKERCYFNFIENVDGNFAIEPFVDMMFASTGYGDNLEIRAGLSENTLWWDREAVSPRPPSQDMADWMTDAILYNKIAKEYGVEGDDGIAEWSDLGGTDDEPEILLYDDDITRLHRVLRERAEVMESQVDLPSAGSFPGTEGRIDMRTLTKCRAEKILKQEEGRRTDYDCPEDDQLMYHYDDTGSASGLTSDQYDEFEAQIKILSDKITKDLVAIEKDYLDNYGFWDSSGEMADVAYHAIKDILGGYHQGSIEHRALNTNRDGTGALPLYFDDFLEATTGALPIVPEISVGVPFFDTDDYQFDLLRPGNGWDSNFLQDTQFDISEATEVSSPSEAPRSKDVPAPTDTRTERRPRGRRGSDD